MSTEFYHLSANDTQGRPIGMSAYKGKTLLIVNTATKCGLTPQFEGLEELYERYRDKGLVVLGFPCNQFGGLEPEGNETMADTCKINYGVTFPLFEKIEVNGKSAHPIFRHLERRLRRTVWQQDKMELHKVPSIGRRRPAGAALCSHYPAGLHRIAYTETVVK